MRWFLALVTIAAAVLLTAVLILFGRTPEVEPAEAMIPPVEYLIAEAVPHQLSVRTQGVVSPATETTLIPEVSGRIVEISERFDAGGFFEEGDLLLRIESTTHEAALAEAESALAAARLALAQEQAASAQAEQDWRELGRGDPSELALREPQQAMARADIAAAEKAVAVARRNLDRTAVRAPFAGRVRETMVDLGEIVTANSTRLATLYAIETAEIRLPLNLREIGLLDLPESYRGEDEPRGPVVTLKGEYGRDQHTWEGTIERVEGVIDPRTRLVYAVAVVRDPYRREPGAEARPPLKIGLFVDALIEGRQLESVFVLPREVMVNEDELLVVEADDTLHRRRVDVVHSRANTVVISGGLSEGDRVNRTPIEFFIEGMPVNPRAMNASPEDE